MKKCILIILISLAGMGICRGQQYGWSNISASLPDFYNDTVIINGGADTIIASISDICFLDDNHGWICTDHPFTSQPSAVLKTTDGGQTWTEYSAPQSGRAIYMIDSDTGYFGGTNGMIYKTVDGAANWTYHGSLTGALYTFGFPPWPANTGWAGGYNGKLVKITPQGVIPVNLGLFGHVYCIDFPSVDRGYALLDYQMIIFFQDGEWHVEASYPSSSKTWLHFLNDTLGWCVGSVFLKTTVGIDWYQTDPSFVQTGSMMGVYFIDENTGWAVGTQGQIAFSLDGGNDWTMLNHNLTDKFLSKVVFTSAHNGYIIGGNKTLLKYSEIVSTNDQQQQQKLAFFPNPTPGKIRYNLASGLQDHEWMLYDAYGRQLHEPLSPTDDEIDISGLPPAIYFLRIKTGQQVYMQKIIKIAKSTL
ncbi:MAG: YCF48-related protein [Bacteroidales bacterium]